MNILLKRIMILIAFSPILASCSVIMAAKKDGTNIEKVQACRSRGQFLALGGIVVHSERTIDSELIETYQFKKESGSTARALMHGVLDVSTLGLWEVVGTPIEVCSNDKTCFSIKVYYDKNENVKKMELM